MNNKNNLIAIILILVGLVFKSNIGFCAETEYPIPLKKITSFDNATVVVKKVPPQAAPVKTKSTQTQSTQTLTTIQKTSAKKVPASTPTNAVQPIPAVDFALCNKSFKIDSERLFYLTLSAVNANRFKIEEIQSKSGYVLFSVNKKQFLASVMMISPTTSMLKITPSDNIYYFPVGIVQNMFKYIELNQNVQIEKLGVIQKS